LKRIYRVQSKEHKYFIPTALRCHNLLWLENNIDISRGIDLNIELRDKINFPGPERHPDKHSVRAFYLSLKHILIKIEKNPVFNGFIKFDLDFSDIISNDEDDNSRIKIDHNEFDRCFMGLKESSVLNTFEQNNGTQPMPFLKISQHFQHFNINFNELPYIEINSNCDKRIDRFPTMCLDFSDNTNVIETFGFIENNTSLYSIDIDKVPKHLFYSYEHEYDYKINTTLIGKNTNKLMKIQKGYCIYWPWRYSIQELSNNKMFDFKIECKMC